MSNQLTEVGREGCVSLGESFGGHRGVFCEPRGLKKTSSILADRNRALVYEPKCGGGGGLRSLSQCV